MHMKPSDLFGVVVRSFGIFLFMRGLWYLAYAGMERFNIFHRSALQEADVAGELLCTAIVWLIGGVLLLRGADLFVAISYPRIMPENAKDSSGSGQNGL